MTGYAPAYRLGFTPWERCVAAASTSIGARLDRAEADRPQPPGRALDLGCGRGLYTVELARRGWEAVEAAFPGWELLPAEPAETRGLGWPLSRTSPRWYRLRQPPSRSPHGEP